MEGTKVINSWKSLKDILATSKESDTFSKDLNQRGFKFVGSTICYAFMQAVGMVNDHIITCYRYNEILELSKTKADKRKRLGIKHIWRR